MRTQIENISNQSMLSEKDAYDFIIAINEERFNPTQLVAAISFLIKRPITVDELTGFKNALLDLCIPVQLHKPAIDVCGTGGDQKDTFNISTLSAIVLAASGVPVAKHGNHGASSVSGSSDILQHLGYSFKTTTDALNEELERHNICFIHAPLFHPTLQHVSKIRRELGIRTFFNLLGPLVNPANVKYKYVGVYSLKVARLYNYVLQNDHSNYCIVHSLDGYDEISLTGAFKTIHNTVEKTHEPIDLGYKPVHKEELYSGENIDKAAKIFMSVLNNKALRTQKDVVVINSAFAMQTYFPAKTITDCIAECEASLASGRAYQLFKNIIDKK